MSKYNVLVEDVSVEAVFNKLGGVKGAKRFLSGKYVLIEQAPKPVSPIPEVLLNFEICVNRSAPPRCPPKSDKWMHPKLGCAGPTRYDLQRDVEPWLHPDQFLSCDGIVKGDVIYEILQHENALIDQLGLADLLAIQAKGIAVFRRLFAGRRVFGWKNIARGTVHHSLSVPYLKEGRHEAILDWRWLGDFWHPNEPALRFLK